jgi:hypothetical protein
MTSLPGCVAQTWPCAGPTVRGGGGSWSCMRSSGRPETASQASSLRSSPNKIWFRSRPTANSTGLPGSSACADSARPAIRTTVTALPSRDTSATRGPVTAAICIAASRSRRATASRYGG